MNKTCSLLCCFARKSCQRPHGRYLAWVWAAIAVGALLLAHALHLVLAYRVFHFGVQVITACGAGCVLVGYTLQRYGWAPCKQWLQAQTWRWRVWCASCVMLVLWLCSVAVFFNFLYRNLGGGVDLIKAIKPAIVILGSGSPVCQPSKVLQTRLDKGLELARQFPAATVLVSGGRDFSLPCTEAELMGDYLRAHGVSPQRIVQEEASTSTQQNMRLSLPLLRARGFDPQAHTVLLVTSDFHALRARLIAQREGYVNTENVNAVTPLPHRYAAWLREYFAFISGWLLQEY